ncbi:secreted RxLR effector protein 161-like [Rutidosis leptorrhynchoides]|uniref:secreted RxLR effector protein 161-like n=1 Tax=Rutidosis leptorrhynchoides TaxID=125765 RepID=UPI003A98F61F
MVGSLMYVTASRPDITLDVSVRARFQSNPKKYHSKAVVRIFQYLKVWKSTSGSLKMLGSRLVCWSFKKQNCVSLSTAQSEYIAAAHCCSQVLWKQTQLLDYDFTISKTPIYCDS